MGAAYYVVVNSDDPDFDTTVDGKALSRHGDQIDAIAARYAYKSLDAYCSLSADEARAQLAGLLSLEDESDLPPDADETLAELPPEEWYDAEHGLDFARRIGDHVRQNPNSVKDPEAVLYDLDAMASVMTAAREHGLKWHLQVDF